MAYRLALLAKADLDGIWHRITTESGSMERAERFIDKLTERFHLLADFPKAGPSHEDYGAGYRGFPVEEYVIVYCLEGDDVVILRVPHGHQDIPALFGA